MSVQHSNMNDLYISMRFCSNKKPLISTHTNSLSFQNDFEYNEPLFVFLAQNESVENQC